MISWIQKYFQHHFKSIFAVLLALTIVSFVFVGTGPGFGGGDRRVADRPFFKYNLTNPDDQSRVMGDAMLSANLQLGGMGNLQNEQIQQYAFTRAAALSLADEWHIPAATEAEVKDAITKMRMFAGENGEFDPKVYAQFRDSLKDQRGGASGADIARVISDDIRVEKVNKLVAGPGYVLPRDVKSQLERADTTWTLATATVDYAAFNANLKPTDAELTKFFEENSFRYEIPPRVVASYVEFPAANYTGQVNVTDADVRAFYDLNPARFPKPAEVKPADAATPAPAANPDADFAAVRAQVQAALVLERAQALAVKAASDLAVNLFESRVNSPDKLESALSTRNLQPKTLAPFTREAGPAELGNSPAVAEEAFRLNKDQFISDAVPSPAGAVVLFWKDLLPPQKPAFAQVREKVAADYVESEKRKRFVELGRVAKAQIEARLKAGDSFEKAVAAAANSGLKLEAKTLAPFTLRNRPQDVDFSILGALDRLPKGEVSDLIVNPDKGIFVYAADKKVPEMSESNAQFVEMKNQIATMTGRMASNAVMTELVERELKRNEPKAE